MLLANVPTLFTLLRVAVAHITLDELIRAQEGAHNAMVNLEDLSPAELARVKAKYEALAERVHAAGGGSRLATSTPYIDLSPGAPPGAPSGIG